MSSTPPRDAGPAPDLPSEVRPLPARPNLAFERKQAKKLLGEIHRGSDEALARVRAKLKGSADRKPSEFRLADAQFTIAREYGFTSWPRLVEYFETLGRHELSGRLESHRDPGSLEAWVRTIRAEHKDKRTWTAQFLGAYVPRLYGKSTEQILDAEVTLDEGETCHRADVPVPELGVHDRGDQAVRRVGGARPAAAEGHAGDLGRGSRRIGAPRLRTS